MTARLSAGFQSSFKDVSTPARRDRRQARIDTLRHESRNARLWVVQDDQNRKDAQVAEPAARDVHTAHGFNGTLGLSVLECTAQRVVAELTVSECHHQPWGIVHGGVYCAVIETVCSLGAQLALTAGFVVGVDNHTSFLKATRSGTLRASAHPLTVGKRTQLWEANIENAQGDLVATGRVRLMTVAAGAQLAGAPAGSAK
jgi:1,4-dihydroxy-2-naphthoyl-CoA hydrolase